MNTADYEALLRIPGLGVKSAQRIVQARRHGALDFDALTRIGVVLKRARWFATCRGKALERADLPDVALRSRLSQEEPCSDVLRGQMLLFSDNPLADERSLVPRELRS